MCQLCRDTTHRRRPEGILTHAEVRRTLAHAREAAVAIVSEPGNAPTLPGALVMTVDTSSGVGAQLE